MPALFRTFALRAVLAASCLAGTPVSASDGQVLLPLSPEPGVSARIEKQGPDYVLIQPDGASLPLLSEDDVEEGAGPDFDALDYDFDGHPDVSLSLRAGMVNLAYAIWRYDPGAKAYVPFEVPESIQERQNCKGLWHVERLVARRTLRSSCRGGPRWHADLLRVEPGGVMWLAGQTREPEETFQWPYFGKPALGVMYDRQGTVLTEAVLPSGDGGAPAQWQVPVPRLALYSAPDEQAVTPGYLVEGDRTTLLAFRGEAWMQIGYEGKAGRIVRWVSLKDAYDLARRYDASAAPLAPLTLWAMDYRDAVDEPDYYRNLFTLLVDHKGESDIDIYGAEIHLIFTGADGASTVHKLYDLSTLSLKPGETRTLDDNPIERHDERHVIFHAAEEGQAYVPFFPPGLAPGRYRVRPVLTAPSLPGPVYARDPIEIDYPPTLPSTAE